MEAAERAAGILPAEADYGLRQMPERRSAPLVVGIAIVLELHATSSLRPSADGAL